MKSQGTHYEFCRVLLAEANPDRYLVSLFVPEREALWALFAFEHEIAKTRLVVSEAQLGLIRLKWWQDEIAKIYAGEDHAAGEVLDALAETIKAHDLPKDLFDSMVAVRAIEVSGEQPEGVDGAMQFIDALHTPVLSLAALICGDDIETEPVAAIALNAGLVDVVRRAKKKSLVAENIEVFQEAFVSGVETDSRILRANQSLAELCFGHFKVCGYGQNIKRFQRPPAFLSFRLWTKMLF